MSAIGPNHTNVMPTTTFNTICGAKKSIHVYGVKLSTHDSNEPHPSTFIHARRCVIRSIQ